MLCYNTLTEQGITLKLAPEHLRMQSAWGVARAALELVRSGGLVSGEELAPVYLPPVSGGAGAAGAGS